MIWALAYLAVGAVVAALRIDWAFLARPSTHHNVYIGAAGVALTVLTWPLHAAETVRCVHWRRTQCRTSRRGRLKGGPCPA